MSDHVSPITAAAPSRPPSAPTSSVAGGAKKKQRARLRHAAFTRTPVLLAGGRKAQARRRRRIEINHHELRLPALPDALDGLRITHISDLHTGELLMPDHLPHIIDTCMRQEGDLIAVTGDLVDLRLGAVIDPLLEALRALEAPLGVHLVLGNHDYLDDGDQLAARLRDAGLSLLINEALMVERQDRRIAICGMDYEHKPRRLARLVRATKSAAGSAFGKADLSVLLAHHPDAFDAAHRYGFDVTLSGHTHGGQVTLSKARGKKGSIGLGSLAFKYPRGIYRRGDSYLHVTSGVGSWFPVRFRCPAEIATLTLRSGDDVVRDVSHP